MRYGTAVGLLLGALLAALVWLLQGVEPWLVAWLLLFAWCWLSGGLHLDGLADLADACAAAHADPARLTTVFRDPHLGSFGTLALLLLLSGKLITLMLCVAHGLQWWLWLIPAWARWGTMLWAMMLPPLFPGRGADYAAVLSYPLLLLSFALLFACSLWLCWPLALVALAAVLWWLLYLRLHLGGMNGDCLGAGIEWCELLMLLGACLVGR